MISNPRQTGWIDHGKSMITHTKANSILKNDFTQKKYV